jgi:cytochrome c5
MMQTCRTSLCVCLALSWITASWPAFSAEGGAKTFEEVCTQCHTAKRQPLNKKQLTKEQWKEAIERMAGYGVEMPKAKLPDLLDFLVGMNAAAADPAKE